MLRGEWLKVSLIKARAQLIKRGESWSCDPVIQTRTKVSILASGMQPARTAVPVPVNREAWRSSCPPTLLSRGSSHCRRPQEDTGGRQRRCCCGFIMKASFRVQLITHKLLRQLPFFLD